ncbi:MAG: integration host factor subunit alpha [Syntrophales bacterium]
MTKKEIIDEIRGQLDMTQKEANEAVESTLEIIKEELEQGREVMISGFGKWSVLTKKPRRGRNPQTGEAITITGRKVVTFKVSPKLKQAFHAEGDG